MTGYPRRDREHGQVSAFVAVISAGLLLMVGVVWDGSLLLGAHTRASNYAEGAARAAAQALDEAAYRRGIVRLDARRARELARDYLEATGEPLTHSVHLNAEQVTVQVFLTQPLAILGTIGVGARTIHGQATARAIPAPPAGGPG